MIDGPSYCNIAGPLNRMFEIMDMLICGLPFPVTVNLTREVRIMRFHHNNSWTLVSIKRLSETEHDIKHLSSGTY